MTGVNYTNLQTFNPLSGIHIGTVIDNIDPEKIGRVKVEIEGLTSQLIKEAIPWFNILLPAGLGGSFYTSNFAIPQVNTTVVVVFPDDNIYSGIVVGTLLTRLTMPDDKMNLAVDYIHPEASEHKTTRNWDKPNPLAKGQKEFSCDFADDYPFSWGWVSNALSWVKENMMKRTFEFVHNSFTRFKIYSNGDTILNITGNLKIVVEKDLYFEVRGNNDNIVLGSKYSHTLGSQANLTEGRSYELAKKGKMNSAEDISLN